MKAPRTIPPPIRDAQARASDPAASAFVSANAGSGKTHVLVQRVIRLMLAGVPPEKILCLTFTNAAAAEMSNRVLKELGVWVMADDARLAVVGRYVILFRIIERCVRIERVVFGGRDLPALLI